MENLLPAVGSVVEFSLGLKKPAKGTVLRHEAATEEWPEGFVAFWPTLKHGKTKGVEVFNSWPNPFVTVSAAAAPKLRKAA